MKGRITIVVTQGDIEQGERKDCSGCPIARSAKRQFSASKVAASRWNLFIDGSWYRSVPPRRHAAFVYTFDSGCRVEPTRIAYERTL